MRYPQSSSPFSAESARRIANDANGFTVDSRRIALLTRERPGAVLLLGLINVGLGALSVFLGTAAFGRRLILLIFQPVIDNDDVVVRSGRAIIPPVPNVEAYLESVLPGYTAGSLLFDLEVVLAGLLLVAIGFGLLYMRPWSRWAAVFYSLLTIGCQLGFAFCQLAFVFPIREDYSFLRNDYSRSFWAPDPEIQTIGAYFTLVSQVVFMLGHALAQLLVLVLPSVRAAFRGAPPAPPESTHAGNGMLLAEHAPSESAAALAGEAVS
jgi:hypothetical protein